MSVASSTDSHQVSMSIRAIGSGNRFVKDVPLVLLLYSSAEFLNKRWSIVAVCHDDDTVAFYPVGNEITLETPIAAAVHKIPAFTLLLDLKSYCKWSDSHRSDHFLCHGLRQNPIRLTGERSLHLDNEFCEVRWRRPQSCGCVLWIDVPGIAQPCASWTMSPRCLIGPCGRQRLFV